MKFSGAPLTLSAARSCDKGTGIQRRRERHVGTLVAYKETILVGKHDAELNKDTAVDGKQALNGKCTRNSDDRRTELPRSDAGIKSGHICSHRLKNST
jgi:hypothetical protein